MSNIVQENDIKYEPDIYLPNARDEYSKHSLDRCYNTGNSDRKISYNGFEESLMNGKEGKI